MERPRIGRQRVLNVTFPSGDSTSMLESEPCNVSERTARTLSVWSVVSRGWDGNKTIATTPPRTNSAVASALPG
jgi:hypothetical protein